MKILKKIILLSLITCLPGSIVFGMADDQSASCFSYSDNIVVDDASIIQLKVMILHLSVRMGDIKTLQASLTCKNQTKVIMGVDEKGNTALHIAAKYNPNIKILCMLLDAVPEEHKLEFIMRKNNDEHSALYCAELAEYTEFVRFLIEYCQKKQASEQAVVSNLLRKKSCDVYGGAHASMQQRTISGCNIV